MNVQKKNPMDTTFEGESCEHEHIVFELTKYDSKYSSPLPLKLKNILIIFNSSFQFSEKRWIEFQLV